MESIYTHGNGSSASVIPSQVSHVGFNNLKKWNTSSSSFSESASTFTTNTANSQSKVGLVRLFTKNRNESTEHQSTTASDDTKSISTLEGKKNNLFKLGKAKGKIILSKPTKSKPDLTVQTGGHHGLKIPKKILSSSQDDINNSSLTQPSSGPLRRISSSASPGSTFHNFFHRNHHSSKDSHHNYHHGSETSRIPGSVPAESPTTTTNPHRTAIGLSSQNSNSLITDVPFAMIYKFTDPDFVGTLFNEQENVSTAAKAAAVAAAANVSASSHSAGTNNTDSSNASIGTGSMSNQFTLASGSSGQLFSDLTRRLQTPTDQFIHQKMGKKDESCLTSYDTPGTSTPVSGLGIITSDLDGYYYQYLIEFSKENSSFFSSLFQICKPFYLPSKQRTLSNGTQYTYIGMAIEDLTKFVEENYYSKSKNETASPSKSISSSRKTRSNRSISGGSNSTMKEREREREREKDWLMDRELHDFKVREVHQDLITFFFKSLSMLLEDTRRTSEDKQGWELITELWGFFNERIRFQQSAIFYPFENLYGEYASMSSNIKIRIDSIVLLTFRDAIIIPWLFKRNHAYTQEQDKEKELNTLKNQGLLGKIIECFGTIDALTADMAGNGDGDDHIRMQMFRDAFSWLTQSNL